MVWFSVTGLVGRYAEKQAMGELVLKCEMCEAVSGVGHVRLHGWEKKPPPNIGYDGSREGARHCDVAGGFRYEYA